MPRGNGPRGGVERPMAPGTDAAAHERIRAVGRAGDHSPAPSTITECALHSEKTIGMPFSAALNGIIAACRVLNALPGITGCNWNELPAHLHLQAAEPAGKLSIVAFAAPTTVTFRPTGGELGQPYAYNSPGRKDAACKMWISSCRSSK